MRSSDEEEREVRLDVGGGLNFGVKLSFTVSHLYRIDARLSVHSIFESIQTKLFYKNAKFDCLRRRRRFACSPLTV